MEGVWLDPDILIPHEASPTVSFHSGPLDESMRQIGYDPVSNKKI